MATQLADAPLLTSSLRLVALAVSGRTTVNGL
jgi:hypothetical protein